MKDSFNSEFVGKSFLHTWQYFAWVREFTYLEYFGILCKLWEKNINLLLILILRYPEDCLIQYIYIYY